MSSCKTTIPARIGRHLATPAATIRGVLANSDGNFALFSAIMMPVFLMAAGLAVDTANVMSMKVRLQAAADGAALATSSRLASEDLLEDDAVAYAKQFFSGEVSSDYVSYSDMTAVPTVKVVKIDDDGRDLWQVAVTVAGGQTLTPMAQLLGSGSMNIQVMGKSESAAATKSALSMVLVLDKSGSMDWYADGEKKIKSLRDAVGDLLTQMSDADPTNQYVRVGAVSYDSERDKTQSIEWGTSKVATFVDGLRANGGTDSSDAFKWAYRKVKDSTEDAAHYEKTELVPARIIVFMTDGDNNQYSADTTTKQYCDLAKERDIEVYTVAFDAPNRGKQLLSYCATTDEHFFDASNKDELVRAFKNIGLRASNMISRLVE